ncbi:uncharacterized protein LOC100256259 isoform X2 [Vitis vinifera]|uniref:uncharacterized protein LOC100256259 isoform X2 n=1 Tax=Vitis vinifera TaxID=29760 RepID=UPI0008FFD593|nr:uncharacterized protein LOC100256259 isoform X2 [Vitis vinifera]|eukprot:XP_019077450.1 PREDICTED: centromere protein F isoform X2 [Vitis vinifera]
MPRQNHGIQGLIPGKIRKRGCSSSSSTSSVLQKYRFKRAILVGKRGGSSTPVPTWRLMNSRSPASAMRAMESPRSMGGGKAKQAPVSARKLAATLWEMNEMPSPRADDEKRSKREVRGRERVARSLHSGSLPPHLSDPSHSPVSEIEIRSRGQTPSGSTVGVRTRLKDVSNALTTSKELLKIISRIWGHEDQPSSSMSLISALHAELERARLHINQLIQEQRSDQSEINYLMKCFAEEKAAWKSKEQQVIEAAIESIAGELEVERKLRRRFESLNKKLGRELAETKTSLIKAVKELECEKRAREIMEQVCDELTQDVGEDKDEVEEIKRESAKVREEAEKEREILQLADVLREERAQSKISEAKYQFEEKNAVVEKLKNELEVFMRSKKAKEKGRGSLKHDNFSEIAAYLSRTHFGTLQNEENEDDGEVEDALDCEEDSAESDLHSIELNMDNNNKSYKWTSSRVSRDLRKVPIDEEETRVRKSTSGKMSRRSTSLQRSMSDGIDWGIQSENLQSSRDGLDWGRFYELEKEAQGKGYGDEMQRYKSVKGLRDQILAGSRIGSARVFASPTRQWGQAWPSRDPSSAAQERPATAQGSGLKSRLVETKGEGQTTRRSKR